MPKASSSPLSPADVRIVSVRAGCDERTVKRYLRGEPQPSTTVDRIEGALRWHKRSDLVRAPSEERLSAFRPRIAVGG